MKLVAALFAAIAALLHPSAAGAKPCEDDLWPTLGHDPGRTSASPGCVVAPLLRTNVFRPKDRDGRRARVAHAIVGPDGPIAVGTLGDAPALYAWNTKGEPRWTFDTRADIHRSDWPTFAEGHVVLNDDGLYMVDHAGGTAKGKWLDSWGHTLFANGKWFLTNALEVEGPSLFVGQLSDDGKVLWQKNTHRRHEMFSDPYGGIAYESGILVHAAHYRHAAHSTLTAFQEDGSVVWKKHVSPRSFPVVARGVVFLLEEELRQVVLSARWQKTGERIFARALPKGTSGPLCVSNDTVWVHTDEDVRAFASSDGSLRYAVGAPRRAGSAKEKALGQTETTLALAAGNGTLIVTTPEAVLLLSASDGTERQRLPMSDPKSPVVAEGSLYVTSGDALIQLRTQAP